ncbi:hypothetical protein XFF6166_80077 [Xanthomonas citri pv. fuscans]|nr:hypothetical protein XFF6166_80077 [Xanthomonas citri pv. fuscans]SON99763.1 hypothetical protein XFF6960_200037 [Xanthomonas citri pv. fuscans]SOO03194.1 hypothetical protein XFF7767_150076 [Xanthomonas citri pv. fuscans]SOO09253.1 hypothetical protein XFF6970_330035 [Xanthomonas citri pv. fuscans]SOO15651.1 hypothetical protein XFF7766_600076 [Xanthomonas citri pv. fuscans]
MVLRTVRTRLPIALPVVSHDKYRWVTLRLEPNKEVAHDHRHHQPGRPSGRTAPACASVVQTCDGVSGCSAAGRRSGAATE